MSSSKRYPTQFCLPITARQRVVLERAAEAAGTSKADVLRAAIGFLAALQTETE